MTMRLMRLARNTLVGKRLLPHVLEDDVRSLLLAQQIPDRLAHLLGGRGAFLSLLRCLVGLEGETREVVAIEGVVAAEALGQRRLVGGRDDADRGGAEQPGDLAGKDAEPSARAPDEHHLARSHARAIDQHAVGGEVDEPVAGGDLPGERLRLLQELLRLHHGELGEAAIGASRNPQIFWSSQAIGSKPLHAPHWPHVTLQWRTTSSPTFQRVTPFDRASTRRPTRRSRRCGSPSSWTLRIADRLAETGPDPVVVHAGGYHENEDLAGAGLRASPSISRLNDVIGLAEALLPDHPGVHLSAGTTPSSGNFEPFRKGVGGGERGMPPRGRGKERKVAGGVAVALIDSHHGLLRQNARV